MNTSHVDLGLARNSDWAFTSSVVILVVALLLAHDVFGTHGYLAMRKKQQELAQVASENNKKQGIAFLV